jgi:NitT/TauT family transport system permease protein
MKRHSSTLLSATLILAFLLLVWLAVIRIFAIPAFLLPSPLQVSRAAEARFSSLAASLAITAAAAVSGLVSSVIAGVLIAMVFAQSSWIRRMFFPYTILLQTVPIVAIAPLILMWIGPGIFSVSVIAFIICLAPIIANTTQGLISVERNLVDLFLMSKASRAQILLKLRLPHAMPSLFTGIRISSGIAVIGAITGELFAGSSVSEASVMRCSTPMRSLRQIIFLLWWARQLCLVLSSSFLSKLSSGTSCITGTSLPERLRTSKTEGEQEGLLCFVCNQKTVGG